MTLNIPIDENTTDPQAWGYALADALTQWPDTPTGEELAGWFATAMAAADPVATITRRVKQLHATLMGETP